MTLIGLSVWAEHPFEGEMARKQEGGKFSEAKSATPFDLETSRSDILITMACQWCVANFNMIGLNLWAESMFL